jgi:hypothetical protein
MSPAGCVRVMLNTGLTRDDVIVTLGRLVEACYEAAASGQDLAKRYTAMRAEAMTLNEQYGWATCEEFAAQIPSLESVLETESLDRAFGETAAPGLPVERGTAAGLGEALTGLAAWATGLRLAYETLREMDSG